MPQHATCVSVVTTNPHPRGNTRSFQTDVLRVSGGRKVAMKSYWPTRAVSSILLSVLFSSGFAIYRVQVLPINQAPQVDAGPDETVVFPTANLDGNVTDNGLPLGVLITTWIEVSGPATQAGSVVHAGVVSQPGGPPPSGTYYVSTAGDDSN